MTRLPLDRITGRAAQIGRKAPTAGTSAAPRPLSVEPEFALFMMTTTKCPACRLLQQAAGLPVSHRIHVRRAGDLLTITDAEDLHQVGVPLIARHAIDFPGLAMFRMLSEPPDSMPSMRFRSAAGTVTLGLRDGYWTLTAVGRADGASSTHDHIYHATELRD